MNDLRCKHDVHKMDYCYSCADESKAKANVKPAQDDKANSKINDEIADMAGVYAFLLDYSDKSISYLEYSERGYKAGAQAMAELKDVEIEDYKEEVAGLQIELIMVQKDYGDLKEENQALRAELAKAKELAAFYSEQRDFAREDVKSIYDKMSVELKDKTEALGFYAEGKHFDWCGHEDFEPENPSGEPLNYECGGAEGSEFTLENGGYAKSIIAKYEGGKNE